MSASASGGHSARRGTAAAATVPAPAAATAPAPTPPAEAYPAWWEDELVEAMKFAIEVQELKLADRVRDIEAREQKLADRVRDIETREWVVGACERLFGQKGADWKERSAEEAERVRDAIVALQAAGTSSGDPVFAEAAAKLQTEEVHAQTVASALLQARHWKASGPPSARTAIKAAELALRDVVVRMCSSHTQPGDRRFFEARSRAAFGGSLDTEMRAALLLSYHKWHKTAGTPSNSSRRPYRPRRPRTGKHRQSHSAPPSTGGGRASGSFHDASGDAEDYVAQPEALDESGTDLGHSRSEGDLRRASRGAVVVFCTADI